MSMSRNLFFRLLSFVIIIILCPIKNTYGFWGKKSKSSQSLPTKTTISKVSEKDIYQWFKTYSEVVSLVEQKAFRSVDFSKFIQGSLKAGAAEIDAHSAFFNQESYKAAMESASGEFSGIGVSIMSKAPDDDALVIIDVIVGGPAAKAGIKSGDKIVEADGHKFKGLSTDEAVQKLKGKAGSSFAIKILRDKKPLEMKVTRDIIKDQASLCYLFKNQGVYYLSLKLFSENIAQQTSDLLKLANKGTCKGLIFDVRRNPGGILQAAIDLLGLLLDKNSLVVITKDKNHEIVDKYFTKSDPILKMDVPIFILIDNFTASAAEIFAGALRYYSMQSYEKNDKKDKRNLLVFLVGTETFGKGSVQEVIPISNGCALKLTTMLYYLPDGSSIQAKGIGPDFLIKPKLVPSQEMKWVAEMFGKESSLKQHITAQEATGVIKNDSNEKVDQKPEESMLEIELEGQNSGRNQTISDEAKAEVDSPLKWEERQKDELGHDVQVQAAVNMINLFHVARQCNPKMINTREKALNFLKTHYLTDDKVEVEKVN